MNSLPTLVWGLMELGGLGDQERESVTKGLCRQGGAQHPLGEAVWLFLKFKVFFLLLGCVAWDLGGIGRAWMNRPSFGGLMGVGWGWPLPGSQGKKSISDRNVIDLL